MRIAPPSKQRDAAVFRRDHAWFWYGVPSPLEAKVASCVGFQIDPPHADVYLGQNEVEGPEGVDDAHIKREVRSK